MRYAILIAVLLVGCATPEQRAQRLVERYGPFCEKLGFTPQTDAFANCIQQQAAADTAASQRAYGIYQQTRPRTCYPVGNTVRCD